MAIQKPDQKELVPVKPRPHIAVGQRGVQITSVDEMFRFAEGVAQSGLAPRGLEKPQALLVAMQMGAELGLPPMAAIQNIAVINGRPSVWGDAMLGVCRDSGLFDEAEFEETQEEIDGVLTAKCTVRRLPNGNARTHTFSMKDAATAGLDKKSGTWQQYPKRMLQMRARSWALRDAFSDVLRGFHQAEEARDIIDVSSDREEAERLSEQLAAATKKKEEADAKEEQTTTSRPADPA